MRKLKLFKIIKFKLRLNSSRLHLAVLSNQAQVQCSFRQVQTRQKMYSGSNIIN